MEDITDRITRLAQELKALHMHLHCSKFQDCSWEEQDRITDHLLHTNLGQELRKAVDLLSHFLWCYIESAAANVNEEVDYAQQSRRLRQITGTLRLLHDSACPLKESLTFMEHATMTVNRPFATVHRQEQGALKSSA